MGLCVVYVYVFCVCERRWIGGVGGEKGEGRRGRDGGREKREARGDLMKYEIGER